MVSVPRSDSLPRRASSVVENFVFGQVFKQITGKGEIDRAVVQEIQVSDAAHLMLDPRRQVRRKAVPRIERDAAASDDGVDEITIACTQV